MKQLSVIILSFTNSSSIFEMTMHCLNSIAASEPNIDYEVIIVESNENLEFQYPAEVKLIFPKEKFNFHRFLNIGIKAAKGKYLALCNNDLVFHQNWFTEMMNVKRLDSNIVSFSPAEEKDVRHANASYHVGYKVQKEVKGWCIVAERTLFDRIGLLDETFDFYYADNDYSMTLKKRNVKHALVYNSKVDHLGKRSTSTIIGSKGYLAKYNLPAYLRQTKYAWVLENEKALNAFLKFHIKWGSPDMLYSRNILADKLRNLGLGFLNRLVLHEVPVAFRKNLYK
ncbi:MAG TPA: glycosyltransferase [Flavobacterium sp.]|nr:glycosyltransferase [Flavobacterium sp.]